VRPGQLVRLGVRGLAASTRLKVFLGLAGQQVSLGKVRTDAEGRAILPGFSVPDAGTYLVTMSTKAGNLMIKVVAG
jgi:hypothetical protein